MMRFMKRILANQKSELQEYEIPKERIKDMFIQSSPTGYNYVVYETLFDLKASFSSEIK
jgi:hypothetical protein